MTNAFSCVFVFQASRNVESLSNLARVEHGPNVLFLSAFFVSLCPVFQQKLREASLLEPRRDKDGASFFVSFLSMRCYSSLP